MRRANPGRGDTPARRFQRRNFPGGRELWRRGEAARALPPPRRGLRVWAGPVVAIAVTGIGVLSAFLFFPRAHGPRSYDSVVLSAHPSALWDMSASGAVEPDRSGHHHDATYRGPHPASARLPDGGRAAALSGRGSYLQVPSSPALSIANTGQLTVEAWMRPQTLQLTETSDPNGVGYVNWMGKCQQFAPSCEWALRLYSAVNPDKRCNSLAAYAFNLQAGSGAGADWQPACNLLASGQWLYVVAEYQTRSTPPTCGSAYPGTVAIWVNGVPRHLLYRSTGCMSQHSVRPQAADSPLDIGTMALSGFFAGAVGRVAVYDHLLSQAQIDMHYMTMTGSRPFGDCFVTCAIPVPTPSRTAHSHGS